MAPEPLGAVTQFLHAIREGDGEAKDRLIHLVYNDLRRIAARLLFQEGTPITLEPTDLVHETYLCLVCSGVFDKAPNRHYFFAAAVQAMRRILVSHARRRRTEKRGEGWQRVAFDAVHDHNQQDNADIEALHEALDELARLDERQSQVVVLRFFGGFTVAEIADRLGVSVSTVESDFRLARAWLHRRIGGEP